MLGQQGSRSNDPLGRAASVLRERTWARRLISALSVAMLLAAVGVLGYPVYTNLYQDQVQGGLTDQLASPELEQAYRAGNVAEGQSLTRLKIPSLDVDVVVVEGTTVSALRAGAGHYRDTPLPCEPGNVAIAGHRTTYGKPFSQIDRMKPGDLIILETPVGSCTYSVNKNPFIVAPTDFSVVAPTPNGTLTLTTCHPRNSAAQRLIVQADLQGPAAGA
ncbi:MAG: sortase [Actinobacteria bacterium]|nr:sortase [Actinomycetota bacterium]MBW3642419.1 sortase [Actinomycetota bacterium]